MNKLLLSVTIASVLAGCSKLEPMQLSGKDAGNSASSPAVQQVQLGSGIDLSAMDTSVRPQDDFWSYVNGSWINSTEIPADKPFWGSAYQVVERNTKQVKDIILEAAANAEDADAVKIGALYNSFMNEKQIEAKGLGAIAGELSKIDKIDSRQDLTDYFAYGDMAGYNMPFGPSIDTDVKDTDHYIATFRQGGLDLRDRDFYFDESDKGKKLQQAYMAYLVKVQQLAELENTEAGADQIYQLEKSLAEHQRTRVENRDPDKTYNKMSVAELAELMPAVNWDSYLSKAMIANAKYVNVAQPEYLEATNKIIGETDLATWRRYLKVKVLTATAPYLYAEMAQAHFDFFDTAVRGTAEMEPRWKRAVNFVSTNAGELVGKRYVEKHFPPQAKARMVNLVDNLKAAYRESIESLTWMSDETKQQALDKLANFTTKIGYPDVWRDYSDLKVNADDLAGNLLAANLFKSTFYRNKLGKPVDRDEWFMSPQTVNAYYSPSKNEIVFPAGILQPPFFNMQADDAANYGAIGAVIGHEMGHGFDDQGSKFDAKGYLHNWWTDADRANFEKRTGKLVAQYNAFEPLEGEHVNGALTLGENIGDLSGLGIAYKAYKESLDGKDAPVIDGFSGDQRFFLGWAQVWRSKFRDEFKSRLLKIDPHSPNEYRVKGILPNISAFYDAFGVKEGDGMYLPEDKRVVIW